jgi:hypothetical protein
VRSGRFACRCNHRQRCVTNRARVDRLQDCHATVLGLGRFRESAIGSVWCKHRRQVEINSENGDALRSAFCRYVRLHFRKDC